MEEGQTSARLHSIVWQADGIHTFEFRAVNDALLPAFTPGAHVDVLISNSLNRSYSLINAAHERDRYVIAVQKARESRGGSRDIHVRWQVGDIVSFGRPRNNFALEEAAPHTFLIAGGIGITPFIGMLHRLRSQKMEWTLHYACRTRSSAAFLGELSALPGGRVHFHFDGEHGGQKVDLQRLVMNAPPDAHLYCCGPAEMLAEFKRVTVSVPTARVHLEHFGGNEQSLGTRRFMVTLQRSGRSIWVEPAQSILDALALNQIHASSACREGVCGTCETTVLAGLPEHRDHILSAEERAAGRTMMICCSRAISDSLVLDL